jgi:phosphoadenosine phosphosulfate reductase
MLRDVRAIQAAAEGWSAEALVRWALREFRPQVAIASSFGAEDVVLIHLAVRTGEGFGVFTLDTDFLFPETYALIETIEQRYGVRVERCHSGLSPEEQAQRHGEALWTRDPDLCCKLRKVEPLKKKLSTLEAWVTGIRREQAPTRAHARKVEWDAKFGLVKLNPLADWTWDQVWEYIRAHKVPYNPLHERNYPSIGCTYCTRPVKPGEGLRAGRWSGFEKSECGLHSAG